MYICKDEFVACGLQTYLYSTICIMKKNIFIWLWLALMLLPFGAWSQNEMWSIRFDANGGVGTMRDTVVADDSLYCIPRCTYTREGYDLVGWSSGSASRLTR